MPTVQLNVGGLPDEQNINTTNNHATTKLKSTGFTDKKSCGSFITALQSIHHTRYDLFPNQRKWNMSEQASTLQISFISNGTLPSHPCLPNIHHTRQRKKKPAHLLTPPKILWFCDWPRLKTASSPPRKPATHLNVPR